MAATYKRPSDWIAKAPVDEIVEVIVSGNGHRAAEITAGLMSRLGASWGELAEGALSGAQDDPFRALSLASGVLGSLAGSGSSKGS